MWELYTFWGFIPVIIAIYSKKKGIELNIPLLSFITIAIGGIGAVTGGYLSRRWGSAKVAGAALLISGMCCFVSPLAYHFSLPFFILFMLIWGFTVSPDSPQFSTLVAQYAPEQLRGTALTIYNSIGFSISTISLILIDRIFYSNGFFAKENTMLLLGFGALAGLPSIFRLIRQK
jgi:MFS family permease